MKEVKCFKTNTIKGYANRYNSYAKRHRQNPPLTSPPHSSRVLPQGS